MQFERTQTSARPAPSVRSVTHRSVVSRQTRGGRRGGANAGPRDLFETRTVAEVREVEKETQRSILVKQQDLQQLVSARYRDLIEAADSVIHMKTLSGDLNGGVQKSQKTADDLLHKISRPVSGGSAEAAETQKQRLYAVAAQLKLLVVTPEQIWAALESHDFLRASRLYVVAENVHTHMRRDKQYTPVLGQFPFLSRQWSTLEEFPRQILAQARARLRLAGLQPLEYAAGLCAVSVLEGRPAKALLGEFLPSRLAAVDDMLTRRPSSSAASAATSTADEDGTGARLAGLVELVRATVSDVHELFLRQAVRPRLITMRDNTRAPAGSAVPTSLVASLLNTFTTAAAPAAKPSTSTAGAAAKAADKDHDFDHVVTVLYGASDNLMLRLLPSEVKVFRRVGGRAQAGEAGEVTDAEVRETCTAWVAQCIDHVHRRCAELLAGTASGRELAAAQWAVWQRLAELTPEDDARADLAASLLGRADAPLSWGELCGHVLGRPMLLWEEMFRAVFLKRSEEIATTRLEALQPVALIEQALATTTPTEARVDSFIWGGRIAAADVPSVVTTKAACATPSLAKVCEVLDERAAAARADMEALLHTDAPAGGFRPKTLFNDVEAMKVAFRQRSVKLVTTYASDLDTKRKELELHYVEAKTAEQKAQALTKVVFVGRVFQALLDPARELPKLFEALRAADASEGMSRQRSTTAKARAKAGRKDTEEWLQVAGLLGQFYVAAHQLWAQATAQGLAQKLGGAVRKANWVDAGRQASWFETKVAGETESGERADHGIRLPTQVSGHVFEFLMDTTAAVQGAAGHALTPEIRAALLLACGDAVQKIYNEQAAQPVGDVPAYQLFLDACVLSLFMIPVGTMGDALKSDFSKTLDLISGKIDPVNLAVVEPLLRSSALILYQRTSVLFGPLTQVNAPEVATRASEAANKVDVELLGGAQTSLVLTAPTVPRFLLLPISASVAPVNTDGGRAGRPDVVTPTSASSDGRSRSSQWSFMESVKKNVLSNAQQATELFWS